MTPTSPPIWGPIIDGAPSFSRRDEALSPPSSPPSPRQKVSEKVTHRTASDAPTAPITHPAKTSSCFHGRGARHEMVMH